MEKERKYNFEIKHFDKYIKVLQANKDLGVFTREIDSILKEKGLTNTDATAYKKTGIALLNSGWHGGVFKPYFVKAGMSHVYEPYKPSPKKTTPKEKLVAKSNPSKVNTVSSVKGNKATVKGNFNNNPVGFLLKKEGLDDISNFKFEMDDSDAVIFKKVRYVKDLIKGRKNNVKLAILEYYNIQVDSERRYNQIYYYGWKNLNNKKYKFYVGNKNKM